LSWGCRTNNPRGLVLQNFISSKYFKVLAPPGPTYWLTSTHKNPDILDIFVAKIPNNLYCKTENLLEPNSDHSSVMLIVSASPLTKQKSPKLFNSSTDKFKFQNLVDQQISLNVKLKTPADIDLAVNNFTKLIQSAAWSSTCNSSPPNYRIHTQYHCRKTKLCINERVFRPINKNIIN
jgi:hypothetical protein